jgi:hypothetical protein
MPGSPGCGWWLFFLTGTGLIIFIIYYFTKVSKINKENEADYNSAVDLNSELAEISNRRPKIMGNTDNIRVFRKFSVGEVTRHYDSQTDSQVTGWLDHSLNVVGWGVGFSVGSTGIGIGKTGIVGQSGVHLDLSGKTRDNLIGDGFVAVLEENPGSAQADIVRLVVPSDPAAREYIASLLTTLGKGFGEGSYRDMVLRDKIAELQNASRNDISYVSDRLNSILRKEPGRRPTVTVVGSELTEHAILGGAIQFENDTNWYQLFPVGVISKIIQITSTNASNAKYVA